MTSISWRERAHLPLARAGYAAGAVSNRFVVAGGSYWKDGEKRRTAAVDIYSPATDQWTPGPALPAPLSDAVSVTIRGALYVTGGLKDTGPNLETLVLWKGEWRVWPSLQLTEAKITAAGATDGLHIYVVGGQRQFGNDSATNRVWIGDSRTHSIGWTELPSFPGGPHVVSAAAVWNDGLYVFGGFRMEKSAGTNMRDIWRLDLDRHTWAKVGELPESRRAFCAGPGDREILLFGGYTNDFSAQVQSFDPARMPSGPRAIYRMPLPTRASYASASAGIRPEARWESRSAAAIRGKV
jgi:N-acetylneuraminic acid mutarotase